MFSPEELLVCNCGAKMFPNISTGDADGYAWSCITVGCGDYNAYEIEVEDLTAVGIPEWFAIQIVNYFDMTN
jgi:hypothetical protein